MIEIEDELARIKETYFTNAVPFTEEHEETFNSLITQIQNDGIMLESGIVTAEDTEISINHDVCIKVTASTTKFSNVWESSNESIATICNEL